MKPGAVAGGADGAGGSAAPPASLAAGVPAIFTLSGIACDFIQHQKNAWVVRHKNTAEIASAMIKLLGDPSLTANLVQSGRHSVGERFDIRDMTKKLEELYTL